MLTLEQALPVEGKYDAARLANLVDGTILTTDGFRVFRDGALQKLLKRISAAQGLIILTDSDAAGFKIRHFVTGLVGAENVLQAYVPDIYGKEKRKRKGGKEGKLGVEGMSKEVLLAAFEKAGIACEATANPDPLTNFDLYEAGLSGTPNAKERKKALLKKLDLPEFLSTSSLLSCINNMMSKNEFFEIVSKL